MEHIETIIVGAGQAGLATSHHLTQLGREHVVLEQAARPAHVWRDERWDSFTLVTPNWVLKLPGAEYNGPDPDGFLTRDQVVDYFDQYVAGFKPPVRCQTRVLSVEPMNRDGYRVRTTEQTFESKNVVMATGFFQEPKLPASAASLPQGIAQLHSSDYRNPEALPPGGVLVVGSAQSGCQIAEELYQHGRNVALATGGAGRAPRRYRGRDVIDWLEQLGFFDRTPEQLPPARSKFDAIPQLSGTKGGHTINLHQFARDGVNLLGHLRGADGDKLLFAPDMHENLRRVDQFERDLVGGIDGYIQANGIEAPAEELPDLRDGYELPLIEELDLQAAGISTVIWAIGYTFDYTLVKLPVCDGNGFPLQTRGVTAFPGLSFVGLPWMPSQRTGSPLGVGEAAGHIASHIAGAEARP